MPAVLARQSFGSVTAQFHRAPPVPLSRGPQHPMSPILQRTGVRIMSIQFWESPFLAPPHLLKLQQVFNASTCLRHNSSFTRSLPHRRLQIGSMPASRRFLPWVLSPPLQHVRSSCESSELTQCCSSQNQNACLGHALLMSSRSCSRQVHSELTLPSCDGAWSASTTPTSRS